ncbi:sulfatase-like hydrolase/transferase [Reichenbachiella carrageenanivorans]|uniref:Sulfatase-like hydrolase/transferase n=1 Tax=Reichenbachiella carrageenanivorans TaxID=2979869 RepID=A0ABY6D6C3_9BACT|nr:sulfatase-like hydrolase/transferase [Reichenbachiella carrageenanivorans]UXX79385.1 sulfatase-like hydrolase/transferase [Reichenbachiella carrageenanivorans]
MNKYLLQYLTTVLTLVLSCQNLAFGADDTRPNIIVILLDDLGYGDVGFNGATDIPTPELDKLAEGGTIFSSAYSVHPFCGPSRMGLLTGRYAHTFGGQYNLPESGTGSELGIPVSERLLGTMLQEAGYYTGLVGKWHLGTEPQYHPNQRGFDDFYGFLGGGHEYFPDYYKAEAASSNWSYLQPLEHNGTTVVDDDEYLTDELSNHGVKFIQEAANDDKPFFLFMSYNAPHTPLRAKTEDMAVDVIADIADADRKTYAAMVYAVDRGVGEMVAALKENDQYDNTLIVFMSDNGGRVDKGATNTPLSGAKGNTLEGGFRVPMFMHWPNAISAGEKYAHPVSALDLYPTFAHLSKGCIADDQLIDGKDIWEDILADRDPRPTEPIFALRHNGSANEVGARRGPWKLHRFNTQSWKLYNIDQDISEKTDLSSQYPKLMDTLIAETKKWSDSHVEPLWFHAQAASDSWTANGMPRFDYTFGEPIALKPKETVTVDLCFGSLVVDDNDGNIEEENNGGEILGTPFQEMEDRAILYPNPTQRWLTIKVTNKSAAITVSVYDISGQMVRYQKVLPMIEGVGRLDLGADIKHGHYTVKIDQVDEVFFRKVIIAN